MKSFSTIILTIFALAMLVSCNTKPCRCYLLEKWGNVVIDEVYIDADTDCGELGYSIMNPYDSSYRHCTDIDDELIDTMDIVRQFWGEDGGRPF